tara:strand:- start:1026 stop:1886 length:861 start_codon:yes stop_codon:yes gene_type:complete
MISICFPVFNGDKFIEKALNATVSQIEKNKIDARILISNNNSTDKTFAICKKFEIKYNYIELHNQREKIPLNENHNFLLEKVKTKYFVFHSHDDERLEGFYAECLNVLEKNNNIVLCFTHADYVDEISNRVYREEKCENMGNGDTFNERFLNTLKNLETCAFHGIYRTDSVKKNTYLDNFLGSDHYFLNKVSCEGNFYEIKKKMMIMNEPISKWTDGSVENKVKKNKNDKTKNLPFLKIYFLSIIYALKKQNNLIYNFKLILKSLNIFFKFLKNDLNFFYKNFKKY